MSLCFPASLHPALSLGRRLRVVLAAACLLAASLPGEIFAGPTVETLVEFTAGPTHPAAALTLGSDGYFYGTTEKGGLYGLGTIYRVTASLSGVATTLVDFTGNGSTNKGAGPTAALVLGSDGSFYGTTSAGGAAGLGTVFKLTTTGGAVTLATLVSFTGNGATNKGAGPTAALVLGSDGSFYGTTSAGGGLDYGTVFKMTPAGGLTTLVSFTGNGATNKGRAPRAGLILANGSFSGTTQGGGLYGQGTVFQVTPAGALSTLVNFDSNNGSKPLAALVLGSDGLLYGTTSMGGTSDVGTVFKMTAAGALTTLAGFPANGIAGQAGPAAALIEGADGSFYGTTQSAGAAGNGTIFKVTPTGTLTTLVEFTRNDRTNGGANPVAALVLGSGGAFYGTTQNGGGIIGPNAAGTPDGGRFADNGTVFTMTANGVLTTILSFSQDGSAIGGVKGQAPRADLFLAADGNFYGTTSGGGAADLGSVFRITPAGTLTTLVDFSGNGSSNKGATPVAPLVAAANGDLLGTTQLGGASGFGTVFRMTSAGVLTTLAEFTRDGASFRGSFPSAGLTLFNGSFYGTTLGESLDGGTSGDGGTVFQVNGLVGNLTTVATFTDNAGASAGYYPAAGLTPLNGVLYGTNSKGSAYDDGAIFRATGGPASVVASFQYSQSQQIYQGQTPSARLISSSDGSSLYGTTVSGGTTQNGTVFKVTPAGALTTLASFNGSNGSGPAAALVLASDGNFYGTTTGGGTLGQGTIFRMTPAGALTSLVSFSGNGTTSRGTGPAAALAPGGDGNFYGTTPGGGAAGAGTIFRLRLGPTPVTLPATNQSGNSAQLNGTVNANGTATTAVFEYGTSPSALTSSVSASNAGSGTSAVSVLALAGLARSTTYYFRLRADNADQLQPQRGATLVFNTNGGLPPVFVSAAVEAGGRRVRWSEQTARLYRVEFNDTLSDAWQAFPGTVTSTSGAIEHLDATAPAPAQRFYRLVTPP